MQQKQTPKQIHPEDKIYEKWGVDPPSHESHLTEKQIEDKLAELKRKAQHHWKQQGAILICDACPLPHATEPRFKDHILTGTDENGKPVLTKIKLSS